MVDAAKWRDLRALHRVVRLADDPNGDLVLRAQSVRLVEVSKDLSEVRVAAVDSTRQLTSDRIFPQVGGRDLVLRDSLMSRGAKHAQGQEPDRDKSLETARRKF